MTLSTALSARFDRLKRSLQTRRPRYARARLRQKRLVLPTPFGNSNLPVKLPKQLELADGSEVS